MEFEAGRTEPDVEEEEAADEEAHRPGDGGRVLVFPLLLSCCSIGVRSRVLRQGELLVVCRLRLRRHSQGRGLGRVPFPREGLPQCPAEEREDADAGI